jgi:hypothetical protein
MHAFSATQSPHSTVQKETGADCILAASADPMMSINVKPSR